jgi:tetratricopeptide (TPR) repeat protein
MFCEISFSIGYCYYEIRLFDKAYKYLEFPYNFNSNNYNYFTEYVNCLERLKDIRVIKILNLRLIKKLNKKPEDADYNLWSFCMRHKAWCLIELERYDEAKKHLEIILQNDPDNEFAKGELEYIEMKNMAK